MFCNRNESQHLYSLRLELAQLVEQVSSVTNDTNDTNDAVEELGQHTLSASTGTSSALPKQNVSSGLPQNRIGNGRTGSAILAHRMNNHKPSSRTGSGLVPQNLDSALSRVGSTNTLPAHLRPDRSPDSPPSSSRNVPRWGHGRRTSVVELAYERGENEKLLAKLDSSYDTGGDGTGSSGTESSTIESSLVEGSNAGSSRALGRNNSGNVFSIMRAGSRGGSGSIMKGGTSPGSRGGSRSIMKSSTSPAITLRHMGSRGGSGSIVRDSTRTHRDSSGGINSALFLRASTSRHSSADLAFKKAVPAPDSLDSLNNQRTASQTDGQKVVDDGKRYLCNTVINPDSALYWRWNCGILLLVLYSCVSFPGEYDYALRIHHEVRICTAHSPRLCTVHSPRLCTTHRQVLLSPPPRALPLVHPPASPILPPHTQLFSASALSSRGALLW
jgi:hypothetical protein